MKTYYLLSFFIILSGLVFAGNGPVARIPFAFDKSRIIISLKINNSPRVLKMLFDTGADGVGLKKSVADEIGVKENRIQTTQVVGASMQVGISEKNTLVFDSLKIPGLNIAIFPDHKDDLDGLFGAAFLRNYITFIDFDHSVIELYRFDEPLAPEGYESLPLFYSGLPELETKIELNSGKELEARLIFDTGAHYPLIIFGHTVVANDLTEGFRIQSKGTTVSMGQSTPTVSGIINSFRFGNAHLEQFPATLQTISSNSPSFIKENAGSLGIDIIKKFNWYIDLKGKRFLYKPSRFFAEPLPFRLGKYLFGFEEERLKILSAEQQSPADILPLQKGDYIESLNGDAPSDFLKKNSPAEMEAAMKADGIELVVERNNRQWLVTIRN